MIIIIKIFNAWSHKEKEKIFSFFFLMKNKVNFLIIFWWSFSEYFREDTRIRTGGVGKRCETGKEVWSRENKMRGGGETWGEEKIGWKREEVKKKKKKKKKKTKKSATSLENDLPLGGRHFQSPPLKKDETNHKKTKKTKLSKMHKMFLTVDSGHWVQLFTSCLYMCLCVRVCVCMYGYRCVYMTVYMTVCLYMSTYMSMCVCVCVCVCVCMRAYMYAYVWLYVCVCVLIGLCVYVCLRMSMCVCVCVCVVCARSEYLATRLNKRLVYSDQRKYFSC